jgi:hypothetical protein
MGRRFVCLGAWVVAFAVEGLAGESPPWQREAFAALCEKYLGESPGREEAHWISPREGVVGRCAVNNSGPGSHAFGFSQAFGIPTGELLASERVFETYSRWQWTQHISLTPNFQLILGSGGMPFRGTQAVFGTRVNFGF